MKNSHGWPVSLLGALVLLALSGCASPPWHLAVVDRGQKLLDQGESGKALDLLNAAREKSPNNDELNIYYRTALAQYKSSELLAAQTAMSGSRWDEAAVHIKRVLAYDEHDLRALQLQSDLQVATRLDLALQQAQSLASGNPQAALIQVNKILEERPNYPGAGALQAELQRATSAVDALRPVLSPSLQKPIVLNFRDQRLMDIFESISRMSDINFVFDRDVPNNLTASLYANNTTVIDAINLLLVTNKLDKKILNKNTLLIYPKNADKTAEYQDMLARTFYLSNAIPKQVFNALRQTFDFRNLYVEERLNAIVMRGTPGEIDAAARLISTLDLPQSEVTLDVSVLEVDKSAALNLGLLPPAQLGFSPQAANIGSGGATSTSGYAHSFDQNKLGTVGFDSKALLNLSAQEQEGHVRILSNPKIRVRNQEKATIKVGGKVPVLTNSTTAVGTTQSANYQDTGLVLTVTPNISLNDELSVHVQLDITNVHDANKAADGSLTYEFTNRSADTTMTVRDNQTQVLGGLISYNSSYTNSGLPGLRSIFALGKLFGQDNNTDDEKQIVLLITPHIDRNLQLPSAAASTFIAGRPQQVDTYSPLILREGGALQLPSGSTQTSAAPDVSSAPPPPASPQPEDRMLPATSGVEAPADENSRRQVSPDRRPRE
jgi:general secretion pathway protein D